MRKPKSSTTDLDKTPETIKDLQPIITKYFNEHQLSQLRFLFYLENAPAPQRIQINALTNSSDGSIMVIYTKNKVEKLEIINRQPDSQNEKQSG